MKCTQQISTLKKSTNSLREYENENFNVLAHPVAGNQ